MNPHKIQKGGVLGIGESLIMSGKFIVKILAKIFQAIAQFIIKISSFELNKDTEWYNLSEHSYGALWIVLSLFLKAIMYLVLFTLGGPIITIIGIAYLYLKLYNGLS